MNFWKGSFKITRKKVNPLQTPIDAVVKVLTAQLMRWNVEQRKEILAGVQRWVLPGTHIQKNPKRVKVIW